EIHDYMRLLFARVGRTYCRQCGREVTRETAEVVAKQLGSAAAGARLLIGFDLPIVEVSSPSSEQAVDEVAEQADIEDAGSSGSSSSSGSAVVATLDALKRKGFQRLLVDGKAVSFDDVDAASAGKRQILQVVVDRIQISDEDQRQRLTDSIETAYLEGGGAAW